MNEFRTVTHRPNEPPMPEPVAYFLTWTTYGTWLPGDERGWVRHGKGYQMPDPVIKSVAESRLTESVCSLNVQQREVVENTISRHCKIRGWQLHAVSCRSNHVHVVVTADRKPEDVRNQLKAWCTRKLKELQRSSKPNDQVREKWWAEKGSRRYIGDEESLEAVVAYVLDAQERKGRDIE
jgi:REP element-mobilizing transposase RayT